MPSPCIRAVRRTAIRIAALAVLTSVAAGTAVAKDLIPLFTGALQYATVPSGPAGNETLSGVAVGDFNGDGKLDVVSMSRPSGLTIQLGNGDGTLGVPHSFADGLGGQRLGGAVSVVVGDFNGDGKLDVASIYLASGTGSGVLIWLGRGDGTFAAPVAYPSGPLGGTAQSIAVADLNGDGRLDLIVTNFLGNSIGVLIGNGDGTFRAPVTYATPPGMAAENLVLGDFNGDGKLDVAVTGIQYGAIALFPGNGDGTFQPARAIPVISTNGLGAIVAADFNKDGHLDLAVSTFTVSGSGSAVQNVYLLAGNGDFTFQAPTIAFSNTEAYSMVAADVDGDGKFDLVLGAVTWPVSSKSLASDAALYFRGNGDGTFQAAQVLYLGTSEEQIVLADLNGDGKPDLVAGLNNSLRGTGTPYNHPAVSLMLQPFPSSYGTGLTDAGSGNPYAPSGLGVGDANGDGRLDLVAPVQNGTLRYLNGGTGAFTTSFTASGFASFGGPVVVTSDFNGDGIMDFAYQDTSNAFADAEIGQAGGTFTPMPLTNSSGSGMLATADFNGDGKPDLVNMKNGAVQLMLGVGDGTFVLPPGNLYYSAPSNNNTSMFVVGDFNGDGKPDVAVAADAAGKTISVLLGNGDGTLQAPRATPPLGGGFVGGAAAGLVAADFNGDGKLDLAMLTDPDGTGTAVFVSVLLGNGDGTFQAPVALPPLPYGDGYVLYAGDVDGDGTPDLVVLGAGLPDPLVLLRGNGDGTFRQTELYAMAHPGTVVAGDFQHDGRLSLALSNLDDSNVTVLLNRSAPLTSPPPSVAVSVAPTAITLGQGATLSWSANNASSCTASGAWSGGQLTSGTLAVTPPVTGTSTYTLSCTGAGGTASGSTSLAVSAPTPVPTVTLGVSPASITIGQSATLTWSTTNATACTASGNWSGAEATSGTQAASPVAIGSPTYTLTCTGAGGSASATAMLTVVAAAAAPTVTLGLSPTSITIGQSATLSWSTTSATACTASGNWSGAEATSGTQTVSPVAIGIPTYTLTCTGAGGSASATAVLTVVAVPTAPTVTISASPTTVTLGQISTLTWSTTNATACTATGAWSGSEPTAGTLTVTPSTVGASTFSLACSGSGGTGNASTTLTVAAAPPHALSGAAGGGGAFRATDLLWFALPALLRFVAAVRRRRTARATVALAALVAAAPVMAGDGGLDLDAAYVGLRVGVGRYQQSAAALDDALAAAGGGTASIDRHRTVGGVYAGVPIGHALAIEAGYVDLGRYPVSIAATGADAALANAAVGTLRPAGQGGTLGLASQLPLGSRFSIEPHAAFLVARSTQQIDTPSGRVEHTRTDAGVDAGLALVVRASRTVDLGAAVQCLGAGLRCNVIAYTAQLTYRPGRRAP